jgi:uncharacterized protein (DUF924 family)
MDFEKVLSFWFQELKPNQWFQKNADLDQQIRARFLSLHENASRGELWAWRRSIQGRLAEIILLDQFSRNMFRETPQSFSQDPLALVLAQETLAQKDFASLPTTQKAFVFMPFMHSESALIHEKAVELFSEPGLESNLDYELRHKAIIDRFGRFPHRNQILGRSSTPEEIEFLKQPGSSF